MKYPVQSLSAVETSPQAKHTSTFYFLFQFDEPQESCLEDNERERNGKKYKIAKSPKMSRS